MREMVEGDIDFVLGLTDREGWGYSRPELERVLRLSHLGCHVLEEDGPAGFITSIQFGETAVIGHLVVSAEARGRKVGRRLLEGTLSELDAAGTRSVVVFSTPAAERLYRSCGFRHSRPLVSMGFTVGEEEGRPSCSRLANDDLAEVCALDEEVFGDDRSGLLKELYGEYPDLCYKDVHGGDITGYVLARRNPLGGDLGPMCSTTGSPEDALSLMESVLHRFRGERLDLGFFDDVPVLRPLMESRTSIKRIPVRLMVRGDDRYGADRVGALGIAGFELG